MKTLPLEAKIDRNKIGIEGIVSILFFILALSFSLLGCAPLLVAGGAVGGYEMATHNK
jgi:hypothetical protein